MKRLEKLKKMVNNEFYASRDWNRMNKEERDIVLKFIEMHEDLDYNDFAGKVNRMYLSGSIGGWPMTKNGRYVQGMLLTLSKTVEGFYGYEGEKDGWVHPLDRAKAEDK